MMTVLERLCQKAGILEQLGIVLKAHRLELEAAGIEAAPQREDARIERDGQEVDDRRRHEQIGKGLAHERAAPAGRLAERR